MMTTEREELIAGLTELLELAPDIRVGQLMAHLGFLGEAHLSRGLGIIDDDELLSVVIKHKDELESHMDRHPLEPVAN